MLLFTVLISSFGYFAGSASAVGCKITSGHSVKQVQSALNSKGGYKLSTDGRMGNATCSAIKAFQKREKLTADGNVGPATAKALGLDLSTKANSSNPCTTSQKEYKCSYVDISDKTLKRYNKGAYISTWTINTGKSSAPTKSGTFWTKKSYEGKTKAKTNDANMYSPTYYNNGAAIHGSFTYPKPSGQNVSNGCIHVTHKQADIFREWGGNGKSVVVVAP